MIVINTTNGEMNTNQYNCTQRLRAGVFVDSEYLKDHCYFGYITHPSLEYDIAVAFDIEDVRKFSQINKILLSKENDVEYKFGILTPTSDKSGLGGYTMKAFIDGKLYQLFIYESQFEEIVYRGHAVNLTHEGLLFENLVNL